MHGFTEVALASVHSPTTRGDPMRTEDVTLVALTPVHADRADDFEAWARRVIAPAARDYDPEAAERWAMLRATAIDRDEITFAFVFSGRSPEDWDLERLLTKALGAEGARRELDAFEGMLRGAQSAWELTEVALE
jgi:hypothetical protein